MEKGTISSVPEMLKLCNKDTAAFPLEGPPDTASPLLSLLESSHPPPWSGELFREQQPQKACPPQDQLGPGLEETKVLLQAANEKGGSGLKELSQVQSLCVTWEAGTWASMPLVSQHDPVFCGSSILKLKRGQLGLI